MKTNNYILVEILDLEKEFYSVCRTKLWGKISADIDTNTANETNNFLTLLNVKTACDIKNIERTLNIGVIQGGPSPPPCLNYS